MFVAETKAWDATRFGFFVGVLRDVVGSEIIDFIEEAYSSTHWCQSHLRLPVRDSE